LCKVKGEFRIIIDKRATSEERVVTIATALSKFDTSELELAEKVRDVIRTYESSSHPTPARSRPATSPPRTPMGLLSPRTAA
jgi:hypothetical protein